MPTDDNVRCERCLFEGKESDLKQRQIGFDPDEWNSYCPECNSTSILFFSTAWCRRCEDVEVPDEGELCAECRQTELEHIHDHLTDR